MGVSLSITLTQNSQSITNNTSSVTAKVVANWTYTSYNHNGNDGVLTLNGTNYSFHGTFNSGNTTSGSCTMFTKTVTVPHNSDGTKTVSASVTYSTNTWGTLTASKSLTLTRIPRQATLTSAPNFNDEGNPVIKYTNSAGNAVTSLDACISLTGSTDDIAYRSISKTGSSYTFNLTTAERNVLRNATTTANSRTVKFYVRTVIGGVTYYSSLSKTLTIVNANPTLSPTAKDVDSSTIAITGDSSKLIKYYSNTQYSANATALKGASIKSYSVTCGNKTLTSATGTFSNVETGTIKFSVTDSRGNTSSKTITLSMFDYVKLTCNIVPSNPTTSGNMTFTVNGKYYSGSLGATTNSLTVRYRYRVADGAYGDWVTMTPTISGTSYTASASFSGFDYMTSYTFEAEAIDAIATVNPGAKTVKTQPVFDWSDSDFNVNVPLTYKGAFVSNCDILWSGAYYMTGGHTATLAKPASDYAHGLILTFSAYSSGAAQNYHYIHQVIPIQHILNHEGSGTVIAMYTDDLRYVGTKYLYIYNDKIIGNDANTNTGTVASGVTIANNRWVLRYVYGF